MKRLSSICSVGNFTQNIAAIGLARKDSERPPSQKKKPRAYEKYVLYIELAIQKFHRPALIAQRATVRFFKFPKNVPN